MDSDRTPWLRRSMPASDHARAPAVHEEAKPVEQNAMFSLSYGLYVLTARDGEKDNGCIINTVMQQTDTPKRISITVNKANYTCDMIKKTGVFNVSVLSQDAPFAMFQHYGFQSGRDTDKFADAKTTPRAINGVILRYLIRTNGLLLRQGRAEHSSFEHAYAVHRRRDRGARALERRRP